MTTAPDTGKYAMLADEGIRRFMAESDALYPPDAVNFTMAQQRAFYDKLRIDEVPEGVHVSSGMSCTIVLSGSARG